MVVVRYTAPHTLLHRPHYTHTHFTAHPRPHPPHLLSPPHVAKHPIGNAHMPFCVIDCGMSDGVMMTIGAVISVKVLFSARALRTGRAH